MFFKSQITGTFQVLGNSQAKIALIPSLLMFPAAFSLFKGAHSKRLMLPTEHCIYNGSFSIPRACFLFTKQRWVSRSFCRVILVSPVLNAVKGLIPNQPRIPAPILEILLLV